MLPGTFGSSNPLKVHLTNSSLRGKTNSQDREFNARLNTQCPPHHPQPPQDDGACGFSPLQLSKPCHFYPQGTVFSIIVSLFWLFLDESCSPSVSG